MTGARMTAREGCREGERGGGGGEHEVDHVNAAHRE